MIENDAHGIEKLLLKTQVSLTSFLQSEVKITHIIVQNNTYYSARSRCTKQQHNKLSAKLRMYTEIR